MSPLVATASAVICSPDRVRTPEARSPSASISTTGSPTIMRPPSRSKWVTMPATSRLVPPMANQTPPSFSSLWISA